LAGIPNDARLYGLLAANLRRVGRLEESVTALERESRLDPRDSDVHRQAGLTYSRLRRYDESIAHWDRLIAMDPADADARIIRGFVYLRRGDVDSLDATLRRLPSRPDLDGGMTYAWFTVHRIQRKNADALAGLDSSRVAAFSDGFLYVPVSLMRAQTLQRLGNLTSARASYESARVQLEDSVASRPRDSRMHIALGLAYAGLHRGADARREASLATEIVPISDNSPAAAAFMEGAIEIYAQLGDADRALERIELLLAMPAGREISVPLLRLDPTFDSLRSDPRFEALINRFSRN
jgi:tetratricopeptide (TPR) repeat protein